MKFKKILTFLAIIIPRGLLAAGGISGAGGGLIIETGHNPWFLAKNGPVDYCIELDENQFSALRIETEKAVTHALAYWIEEFKAARANHLDLDALEFRQQPTCQQAKLKFQMGFKSDRTFEALGDSRKYLAAAIRTFYDQKKLEGKGIIYVAADIGPNAFQLDGLPSYPAWSYGRGGILLQTLVHELGHVFGIVHIGRDYGSGPFSIMATDIIEQIVRNRYDRIELNNTFSMRRFEGYVHSKLPSLTLSQFFGNTLNPDEISVLLRGNILEIFVNNDPWAEIKLMDSQETNAIPHHGIRLYLPGGKIIRGPYAFFEQRDAIFKSKFLSKPQKIIVTLSPNEFWITALVNKELITNIFSGAYYSH